MKAFTGIAIALIALIGLLQLVRALLGWPVSVNGIEVPVLLSWIAFVVLEFVAVMAWRERSR
jgi:hypothetical protein